MSVLKYFNQSTQQWETLAKGEKGEPGAGNGDMVASMYDPANGQKQVAFQADTNTALGLKSDKSTTYTKTEVDAQVANVTIAPGTTSQYYRGDKTWQTLNKAAVGLSNVDNTSDANKPVSAAVQAAITAAILQAKMESYPIGSMYFNADDSTNPGTLLGFGTWVAHAAGRVPVGKAASGTFGTAGANVGNETHRHKGHGDGDGLGDGDLRATIGAAAGEANTIAYQAVDPINPNTGGYGGNGKYRVLGSSSSSDPSFSHFTKVLGYTSTSSSIQPSVVVYIWKRTA